MHCCRLTVTLNFRKPHCSQVKSSDHVGRFCSYFWRLNMKLNGAWRWLVLQCPWKWKWKFLIFRNVQACSVRFLLTQPACLLMQSFCLWFLLIAAPLSLSLSLRSCMQSQQQAHTAQCNNDVLETNDEQSDKPTNITTYLEPECIIGSTDRQGELMFLVKW